MGRSFRTANAQTKLIDKARDGLSVRLQYGSQTDDGADVYQVIRGRLRAGTKPEYTSTSLSAARVWIDDRIILSDLPTPPPEALADAEDRAEPVAA